MSEIEYQGPELKYTPSPGANTEKVDDNKDAIVVSDSYAHKQYLLDKLTQLIAQCNLFVSELEKDLVNYSLPVGTDDPKLQQANASEWPINLGAPRNFISYRYYKSLELRNSSAATYIRRRYEEAARNVTGTNAIDFLVLTKMMLNEAFLAQEFVTTHVGILDDSSERRTVEFLQDWAESALFHSANFEKLFEARGSQTQLSSSDVDTVTPDEASNTQALFKVNLNKINSDLDTNIAFLKKNFVDYSKIFYNNFLGPAVQFRLNVTRKVYPILPGQIGKEVNTAVSAMDNNLSTVLADQTRRNMMFDEKMDELTSQIQMRDTYVSYIKQLADKGTSIPESNRSAVQATDAPHEADYFENNPAAPSSSTFKAPHSDLSGLDDPAAHPQYLLKAGDSLLGDVTLADGVKIDDMIPHLHAHTGEDGTTKIQGSDIETGTIPSSVIDTSDTPAAPTGLSVVTTSRFLPPLGTVFDANFTWESLDGMSFEVQITRAP